MSILIDKHTRLYAKDSRGRMARSSEQAIAYGTQMVGGVTPGKGGTEHLGLPVFDTVADAVTATGADASVIYVPARSLWTLSWRPSAQVSGLSSVSQGVPTLDMLKCKIACDNAGLF